MEEFQENKVTETNSKISKPPTEENPLLEYYNTQVSAGHFSKENVPFELYKEKLGFSSTNTTSTPTLNQEEGGERKENKQQLKEVTAEAGSGVLRYPLTSTPSFLEKHLPTNNTKLTALGILITVLIILILFVLKKRTSKINTTKQKLKLISNTGKTLFTKWKLASIINTSLWYSIAIVFGTTLGFYYKKPNAQMLNIALNRPTEWQKDIFLDLTKASTTFFNLNTPSYGNFTFNWLAFAIATLCFILCYTVIQKTKFLIILKNKVKPYLK